MHPEDLEKAQGSENKKTSCNEAVDPGWWKHIFDEIYLLTDARSVCNEKLTRTEADLIERFLEPSADDPLLDLCGGHGRHSLELARRGFSNLTTLDYSAFLLKRGVCAAGGAKSVRFVRADARSLPFKENFYSAVMMMACSFGYFSDDKENTTILREALRVLHPGGVLLLDIADGEKALKNIASNTWHEANLDVLVLRKREPESGGLRVCELVVSKKRGLIRKSHYFEKLYNPRQIRNLLSSSGFDKIKVHRGLDKLSNDCDLGFMSNRMIVTAKKALN